MKHGKTNTNWILSLSFARLDGQNAGESLQEQGAIGRSLKIKLGFGRVPNRIGGKEVPSLTDLWIEGLGWIRGGSEQPQIACEAVIAEPSDTLRELFPEQFK